MKNIEGWIVALVGIVLVVAFSSFLYSATALKHLDSVFLFESSLSVLESGQPTSRTVASWPDALQTYLVPVEKVCQSDLARKETQAYNVLDNHAYTALYPISLLTSLAGPELTFAFLNALAHVLLLIVSYIFLRKKGVGFISNMAFVICVGLYPAWSYSAVGDYYLDRLYMPFALLSLYFMHALINESSEKTDRRLLTGFVVSTIIAALFTERAAIMMMGEIIFFIMLFSPQLRKAPGAWNVMRVLIVLFGAYLFFYFGFVFKGIEGGGGLLSNALIVLSDPLQRLQAPGLVPFILVNLLFIGVFIPFAGIRYLVLVIGVLLPSLLITTGGAELNGWTTHYHAMYMPFLIFAGSIGYLHLIKRLHSFTLKVIFPVVISGYVVLVVSFLNPYTGKFEEPFMASFDKGVVAKIYQYFVEPDLSIERYVENLVVTLNDLIPRGAKVSAVEGVMPALYRDRHLSLYPIDMDSADYLVISGSATEGAVPAVSGAVSYLGELQTKALNQCLTQRLNAKGFVLLKDISAFGVLVFKRI